MEFQQKEKIKVLLIKPDKGFGDAEVEALKSDLSNRNVPIYLEIREESVDTIRSKSIKEINPDIMISFDLTGFEQCTLTGGIAYNLLNCKQIHILRNEQLPNEKYLAGQLSISMFFYCVSTVYYEYLSLRYPEIPYLREIEGWNEVREVVGDANNAHVLANMIIEVAQKCCLI